MPLPQDHPDWLQINECQRVLTKAKSNIVWEILRQSEPFVQWSHYPKGDVFDHETHSQYFYHAHPATIPGNGRGDENGHFHLFMRKKGIPPHIQPTTIDTSQQPEGSKTDDICHLIAISMDKYGKPVSLFTTNRWVTGETWYQAADVISLLDYFNIDHSYPSWPLNLWLSSMVRVYRDEIITLIKQRDATITEWQQRHPEKNPYEDRALEVTSTFML
jgi:hypothetical protein